MKVTYNWLKDFVTIKLSPRELADKLTMAGLEVTSLEEKGGDFVLEIEITSNRPDWLSVVGIAREVAAVTHQQLRVKPLTLPGVKGSGEFKINIEDRKDCPLYTAKIIKGVKVGPSPDWLKQRLELVGCRSINNIVDITNYILLERGEPLHAFDLDKLKGDAIFVRRARPGERLASIDEKIRLLDGKNLVIADKVGVVAIAGVMGGKDTEVGLETTNILLEAALFDPVVTRRARRALGLQTESSYRFERGVSVETVSQASVYALKLIQQFCGGTLTAAKSSGTMKARKKIIGLDTSTVSRILGIEISAGAIKSILSSLGFTVKNQGKGKFSVTAPSFRSDIGSEIDLIEEVARIFGYDRVPQTQPAVRATIVKSQLGMVVSRIKNYLTGLGLNEAITHSLVDKDYLRGFGPLEHGGSEAVVIANPVSLDQERLRASIIPGLARAMAFNFNQRQVKVKIFEIGRVFSMSGNQPKEELVLGLGMSGEGIGLLHLKGVIEHLFRRLGIKEFGLSGQNNGAEIVITIRQNCVGRIIQLNRSALDRLGVKNKELFLAEISLLLLLPLVNLERKFVFLPQYPEITRDLSFIIREEFLIQDILKAIKEKSPLLLREVKVRDYYQGKQIPPGFKGLTLSFVYRSDERTLTESEINPVHASISYLLTQNFGAKIR